MLRIINWDDNFENNRTRDLIKMRWVPFKNTFDSDGYIELLEHEDGMAHFGAWILIVEVASTCNPRGSLVMDSGEQHTAQTLARKTRGNVEIFKTAINRLISIGWLENTTPQEGAVSPQSTDYGMEGMEGKNIVEIPHEGAGLTTTFSSKKKFVKPTIEEVREYCKERNNHLNPGQFVDYYESKGWVVGRIQMKDWKAAIRTWERNEFNTKKQEPNNGIKLKDLT